MATNKPRVYVVLDEQLYSIIKQLSEDEDASVSSVVKDLVKEALELREDIALSEFAKEREETFDRLKVLSHDEVWK
jgi:hypothetical protein